MPVNADKPHMWKADAVQSAEGYDDWYLRHAAHAYRKARDETADHIEEILQHTGNLTAVTPQALRQNPTMLATLRMMTSPPISRDALVVLTRASATLVTAMEREGHIPSHLFDTVVDDELRKIGETIMHLADRDIFSWLDGGYHLTGTQIRRAALIAADRLCLAGAETVVRDARKQRQLSSLKMWLHGRGYGFVEPGRRLGFDRMDPGSFTFGLNVPVMQAGKTIPQALPIDVAIMPLNASAGDLPLLLDTRSSGDYARANKRRVEDADKFTSLRATYGANARFVLHLSGYFDTGYLGYVAAEGIDWVWEHRVADLARFDLGQAALVEQRQVGVRQMEPGPKGPWQGAGAEETPRIDPEGVQRTLAMQRL